MPVTGWVGVDGQGLTGTSPHPRAKCQLSSSDTSGRNIGLHGNCRRCASVAPLGPSGRERAVVQVHELEHEDQSQEPQRDGGDDQSRDHDVEPPASLHRGDQRNESQPDREHEQAERQPIWIPVQVFEGEDDEENQRHPRKGSRPRLPGRGRAFQLFTSGAKKEPVSVGDSKLTRTE